MLLRTIAVAVLLSLQLPAPAEAAQPAAHVQEGLYEGTGRACGGTLRISQTRVTWRSPFSQCSAQAVMIDSRSEGDATRWAYRLGKPHKQCLYQVVMIERVGASGAWNASGFPSLEAYRADAKDARLDCYLVKLR